MYLYQLIRLNAIELRAIFSVLQQDEGYTHAMTQLYVVVQQSHPNHHVEDMRLSQSDKEGSSRS